MDGEPWEKVHFLYRGWTPTVNAESCQWRSTCKFKKNQLMCGYIPKFSIFVWGLPVLAILADDPHFITNFCPLNAWF